VAEQARAQQVLHRRNRIEGERSVQIAHDTAQQRMRLAAATLVCGTSASSSDAMPSFD
jgi:hypothetical protein